MDLTVQEVEDFSQMEPVLQPRMQENALLMDFKEVLEDIMEDLEVYFRIGLGCITVGVTLHQSVYYFFYYFLFFKEEQLVLVITDLEVEDIVEVEVVEQLFNHVMEEVEDLLDGRLIKDLIHKLMVMLQFLEIFNLPK